MTSRYTHTDLDPLRDRARDTASRVAQASGRHAVVFAETGSVRSTGYSFTRRGGQGARWESRWCGVRAEVLAASDRRYTWRDGLDDAAWNAVRRVDGADAGGASDAPFPGEAFHGDLADDDHAVRRLVDAASAAGRFRAVEAEVRRFHRDVLVCRSGSDTVTRREEGVRWRLRIVPDAPGVFHEWTEAVLPDVPEAWAIAAAESVLEHETGILPSRYPVLVWMAPPAASVWLHEAVGHTAEADFGALPSGHGGSGCPLATWSVPLFPGSTDDEGSPERRVLLLGPGSDRGERLRDARHAGMAGLPSSGHGRRQDYRHAVLPRIGAIVAERVEGAPLLAPDAHPRVLHVRSILSGHVDPRSRRISLDLGRAELRNGRERTNLPAGLRLVGDLSSVLRGVEAVGEERAAESPSAWYRRMCVKRGQVVETANFCPSLLVSGLEIG